MYLDNSATTRPLESVIEAMAGAMREGYFNPSALYAPAMQAEKSIKACEQAILQQLSALNSGGVVFTSGGTEANNLAILGAARHIREGAFVTSRAEHPSVLAAFAALEKQGRQVIYLDVDEKGALDGEALRRAFLEKPALVSLMHVNNETGAMLDICGLSALRGQLSPQTLLHVDGVQGYMRLPVDARMVDMYTLSAHKLHGPKGVGALYVKTGVRLSPQILGGGQQREVRSGTENTPGIAGLLAAMEALSRTDVPRELRARRDALESALDRHIPQWERNGPEKGEGASHILNLSLPGVRAEVMLHALEAKGVYVSTGAACSSKKRQASPVLRAMGIPHGRTESALRLSLSPFSPIQEIEGAIAAMAEAYGLLRPFTRR